MIDAFARWQSSCAHTASRKCIIDRRVAETAQTDNCSIVGVVNEVARP